MTDKAKRLGSQPANSEMYFGQNGEASEFCPFEVHTCSGLTKREYFAGLAMQGILANNAANRDYDGAEEQMARWAIYNADALLEELSKEPENE